MQAIDKLISQAQDEDEEPQLLEGEWKMIWSSQVRTWQPPPKKERNKKRNSDFRHS